ncbi:tetratricopeptide repeat protein [Aeoliella mucimassa]|uniref:tetratricopeptide repeat protein n=1 Tax=Aeoliella mucimassa TaxID=2527972 RepID=UPI0018D45E91|nr:tetratricopeptide repeat protein [Aeoliella mucimassa]
MALFPLAVSFLLLGAQASLGQSSADAIENYNLAARYQKLEQYDLALTEWQRLATKHADDALAASGWHHAGVCQFQLGKYPEAIQSFETFLKKYPKHELTEATLTNMGLAAYNQAQALEGNPANTAYQQAVAAFDRLRKEFPTSKLAPQADYYRAESLYALGQTENAVKAYREWLQKHGDSPLAGDVRLALSVALNETGDADEAIKSLETLLSTNPEPVVAGEALVRLGDALSAAGRYQEAATRYGEALTKGDALMDANFARSARASALFNAGEYQQAAEAYEQLGDVASAGKALYQAQSYAQAAEKLGTAYQAKPEDADLAHWWVRALIEASSAEKALAAADQALAKTSSPELMLAKADAMYALDNQRAASVDVYAAAAAAGEGEVAAEGFYLAAATALELQDFAKAKQYAEQVIAKYGDSSFVGDAQLTLAEAQLRAGEAQAAATTFAELLKSADDEHRLAWSVRKAWAHSTAGDEQAVLTTLQPLNAAADSSDGQQAQFLVGRANYRLKQYPQAIEALKAVAALDPPSNWTAEAKLITGRSQAAAGELDAAIASLTSLIDSQPEATMLAQAYYRRGEANEKAGNAEAAIADYDQVVATAAKHPLAPYAGYRAARLLLNSDQAAAAAERFAKLATEYPDHALAREGQMGQASSLAQAGKHTEALKALAGMDGKNPQVALARGTSLAGLEKWDEAIAALTTATTAGDEFTDRDRAWYELGWAYREAKKPAESQQAFTKLAEQFADSPLARDAMFRIGESHYEAGEFPAAAEWFAKSADGNMSDPELHEKALHMLAWARFKDKKYDQAADSFEVQMQAYPTASLAADAKWMRGESLFALEEYEKALAAYDEAKADKPTAQSLAPLGMLHAGQAANQLKQWDQAVAWLKKANADYPDYAGQSEVEYELGWALAKQNKPDEAMPLLLKVADRDTSPLGARARFVTGELQFAAKDYEPAIRSFFRVAYGYGDRQAPEAYHNWQAESLFEAARCLEQLDRSSAAKKVYAELVERFPEHSKAELAKNRLNSLGGT